MSSEFDPGHPPDIADRIALVRAQLAPISSRSALLDSYERESLNRLSDPAGRVGTAVEVLERAYALRWLELSADTARSPYEEGRAREIADG